MNERDDREDSAVSLKKIGKCYSIYHSPADRLKKLILGEAYRENTHWALRGVSLDVMRGETVGIIGRNGSGKSTLLQIVAGTLSATEGVCTTHGRIAALLELGAGFNAEFTGRENIFLNAAVLGMGRDEIRAKYNDIIEFSELEEAIDQPVKTYSSGMVVRLAFSIAISIDPSIFIIDEALSVGDEAFQRKCFARIEKIRKAGTTIMFVSHSAGAVIELCDRAFLLDKGELLCSGEPKHVVALYQKMMFASRERAAIYREAIRAGTDITGEGNASKSNSASGDDPSSANVAGVDEKDLDPDEGAYYDAELIPKSTVHYEECGARISDIRIETLVGRIVNVLTPGKRYIYKYRVRFLDRARNVRFGMMVKTVTGFELGGAASPDASTPMFDVPSGVTYDVAFEFDALMAPGFYFLNAGVVEQEGRGLRYLNRMLDVTMFRVSTERDRLATGQVDFNVIAHTQLLESV